MADGTEWLAVLQWAVARLTPTNSEADAAVKALLGGRNSRSSDFRRHAHARQGSRSEGD
jgi:hypothetical protein